MPSYRGELRLPSKPAIAATHQGAADSNEALPRRGRGAANAEAWRGDDVASALARGHGLLGSGCGGIDGGVDADLVRKRCSVGRVSRASRPAAGSGFVRRPRRRRRAWLGSQLRGRRSSPPIDALQRALVAYVSCGVSQAFGQPFRAA